MNENDISLRPITLEEYNNIQEQIVRDYNENTQNFVNCFGYYSNDLIGIFFENILVGLMKLSKYANNISPDIYILP